MTCNPLARIVAALTLFVALFAAGCATPHSDAKWTADTVEAASDRVLWEVTVFALQKTNFPVGSGLEPGKMVAVSGWHTQLAPFHAEGTREQCEIRYTALEARKYKVEVRVKKEHNDDVHRPLDLSYAEWKEDPDDEERAHIVLGYIKALLGPGFELKDPQVPLVPGRR